MKRRKFLSIAAGSLAASSVFPTFVALVFSPIKAAQPTDEQTWTDPTTSLREAPDSAIRCEQLMGHRFLTLNTVVRVRLAGRTHHLGA